jgi:hypothetical protein
MKVARILSWLVMCVAFLAVSPGWAADPRLAPQPVVLQRISSLTLNPSTVTGGTTQVLGTVTLLQPASSGGVMVTLRSSNPAIAVVPAGVVVQPGSTSATFLIQAYPVAVNPNVVTDPPSSQISAQIGGSTKSAKLTVLPPSLTALALNPVSVAGSNPSTGQVSLSSAAPAGGLTIGLNVRNPESAQRPTLEVVRFQQPIVTVPSQVVVPAGATSASFPITTRAVFVSTSVQINATHGPFVTKSATLTVLPPGVASIGFGMTEYQCPVSGQSVTATVTLTAPAPAEGMTIPLSLSPVGFTPGVYCPVLVACGPAPVIPASIQFVGGSTSQSFPVAVSLGLGCYQLSAAGKTALLRISPALIPCCSAPNIPFNLPQSVKGGTAIQAKLQLQGVVSNCGWDGHYKLQSSNTNLAQVPAEVVVPIGSSVGTFTITTSAVANNQTVEISVQGCYGSCCANFGWRRETLTVTP